MLWMVSVLETLFLGKSRTKIDAMHAGLHQTARTDPVRGMLERSVVGAPDESKRIASTELSRLK